MRISDKDCEEAGRRIATAQIGFAKTRDYSMGEPEHIDGQPVFKPGDMHFYLTLAFDNGETFKVELTTEQEFAFWRAAGFDMKEYIEKGIAKSKTRIIEPLPSQAR